MKKKHTFTLEAELIKTKEKEGLGLRGKVDGNPKFLSHALSKLMGMQEDVKELILHAVYDYLGQDLHEHEEKEKN